MHVRGHLGQGLPAEVARVLEGPVPGWKLFGQPGTGNGAGGASFGLPRFARPASDAVSLRHRRRCATRTFRWRSRSPAGAPSSRATPTTPACRWRRLEYRFTNNSAATVEAVFSWNARNFMAIGGNPQAVKPRPAASCSGAGRARNAPHEEGAFSATVNDPAVKVNHAWFRGGWFDPLTMAWKDIAAGGLLRSPAGHRRRRHRPAHRSSCRSRSPRASRRRSCCDWLVRRPDQPPHTARILEVNRPAGTYRPWYAGRFNDIGEVTAYWRDHYDELRRKSQRFSDCFYDTTLPPEVIDAVAANLTILKSPTVLRQADGRLWAWEGCSDNAGCCAGSCTHVWNYAQAIPHLFPALERTLRETEFGPSQDDRGHQKFRSALPIRPVAHDFHAAADGQLGGIMKVYREWRISGDTEWLRRLWPKVKASLDYCIETWDPGHKGWLEEPHHNTYDIEFWGPDGMCTSFYLGALQAAVLMGQGPGRGRLGVLRAPGKGPRRMEKELFDGEYFIQKIEWKNLRAKNPLEVKSMVGALLARGPRAAGEGRPEVPVRHRLPVRRRARLVAGAGLRRRPGARRREGRQPPEGRPQVQSQARPLGPRQSAAAQLRLRQRGRPAALHLAQGRRTLAAVRLLQRGLDRHRVPGGLAPDADGPGRGRAARSFAPAATATTAAMRNPFNEYECGHWYARAMSSYALLQGLSGARYDAVEKVLYLQPNVQGDFRCFLSTATGYGTVGVKDGKPFVEVKSGTIDVKAIKNS